MPSSEFGESLWLRLPVPRAGQGQCHWHWQLPLAVSYTVICSSTTGTACSTTSGTALSLAVQATVPVAVPVALEGHDCFCPTLAGLGWRVGTASGTQAGIVVTVVTVAPALPEPLLAPGDSSGLSLRVLRPLHSGSGWHSSWQLGEPTTDSDSACQ